MTRLKYLCAFIAVLFILKAITGVGAVSATVSPVYNGTSVAHMGLYSRLGALVIAFAFAVCAFAIHRRALVIWPVGFGLLGLVYVQFVTESVMALCQAAPVKNFPEFWLPTISVIVLGAAVTLYWGFWWKRQRPYFLK